jgi:hypothetical protein
MDSYMRIHECDHKTHGVGANVITLVTPEAGGRGVCLCMYIAPKDFLIKIPRPTGSTPTSYQSVNDRLLGTRKNPYGVNHRGCFRL